ncbi:MAG: hypothetical protein K8Q92_01685 [Methylophilales bacterium]|nr:hypothetical protein [Methylophilales bacterium]
MKSIYLLLVAALLAGCAHNSPRLRYSNPGAGYQEFADVSYQCERANSRIVAVAVVTTAGEISPEERAVDCVKFDACMKRKGFIKSSDGIFKLGKDVKMDCAE